MTLGENAPTTACFDNFVANYRSIRDAALAAGVVEIALGFDQGFMLSAPLMARLAAGPCVRSEALEMLGIAPGGRAPQRAPSPMAFCDEAPAARLARALLIPLLAAWREVAGPDAALPSARRSMVNPSSSRWIDALDGRLPRARLCVELDDGMGGERRRALGEAWARKLVEQGAVLLGSSPGLSDQEWGGAGEVEANLTALALGAHAPPARAAVASRPRRV